MYFSVHRYEHGAFWPELRESEYDQVGAGAGTGFNWNVPLNQTGMTDADLLAVWHRLLLPAAYEVTDHEQTWPLGVVVLADICGDIYPTMISVLAIQLCSFKPLTEHFLHLCFKSFRHLGKNMVYFGLVYYLWHYIVHD